MMKRLMNKLIPLLNYILIVMLFMLSGCKTQQQTIQTEKVIYKDSIVSHIDTVYVQLPQQTITDVVTMWDTLYLNTDVAEAITYVDYNTNTLKGTLKNKGEVKTVVEYQDRYITRDSLVYVDRPQPYKVVKYKSRAWLKWWFALTLLTMIGIIIYKLYNTQWLQNLVRTLLLKR